MTVFKCDRCGKTYNIPASKFDEKPNNIALFVQAKDDQYCKSSFDLCPSCMNTLWAYLMGKENLIFRGE